MGLPAIKVLLIEDNPNDVDLVRLQIARDGAMPFVLEHTDRLAAALKRLTAPDVGLVLLDLALPDSQGLVSLIRIRTQAPHLPIIVLTALQDESLAIQAMQQGAQDYLVKGQIEQNPLLRSMRYAIERKRIEEELRKAHDELERRVQERTAELTRANAALRRENAERLQAEETIRALNLQMAERVSELQTLLDAAPICIWVAHDPACQRITGNRYLNELFGVPSGTNVSLSAPPEQRLRYRICRGNKDLSLEELPLRRATAHGKPIYNVEFQVIFEDGRAAILMGNAVPLFDDAGRVRGAVAVSLDITERRHAEEERRKLQIQIQHTQKLESLGVLAGGIAHDFNNLLTAILGNASLALLQLVPEAPACSTIKEIENASIRAAELIKQMLAYSGKGRFVVQPLNLSRVVEEMAHLLQTVISKKAVLRFDFDANLPIIEADATQVRQVVMNLITNASDAIGEKSGVIALRTGVVHVDQYYLTTTYVPEKLAEGYYAFLEASDTGCGMDSATMEKIFDPFFTTKFIGRGLGLAAVLGIVRGHKGAIKVYSEPTRGTTFKVLFPASNRTEGTTEATSQADAWRGTGTILVVDDEETVRAVARKMLEKAGFQVLSANDGREGVDLFRQHIQEIAAVLLDLTMPHMNGVEAFREMRLLRSDVRVVLMSGYNEQEVINQFAGKGLAGFVQKPFRANELLAVLRRTLEKGTGGA